MAKQCLKCGYERQDADTAPDYECPKCGAVYAKVEAHLKKKAEALQSSEAAQECPKEKSALSECKDCGGQVNKNAANCPQCGAPIRNDPPMIGGTVVGLLSVVAGVFVAALINSLTDVKPPPPPPPPAINIGAIQLFTDYHENGIAADGKYKGSSLQVTGTISAIGKDIMDKGFLALGTPNPFMSIHAELQDQELSKATILEKGRTVQVRCQGNGMILGDVVLKDCIIIDAGLAGRSP